MPLLELAGIRADLACPRCGAPLAREGWACHRCSLQFPVVQDLPALVDFDGSVLSLDAVLGTDGASAVKRGRPRAGRPVRAAVRGLLQGFNHTAAANIRTFVDLARRSCKRPRVLVVGGGTIGSGIGSLYADPGVDLLAFDIYVSPQIQFLADAHRIPLRDECVDAVVVQAVLEHVIDPHRVVSEIERVLRPGGLVYAETPFLQHVHEGPYDFCRFTESGHRYLFKRFEEVQAGAVAGAGDQMLWSVDYLCRSLCRSVRAGQLARLAFFWLRWLDRCIPARYAVDAASGCYFLGSKSGTTLSPRDLIARYQGAQRPKSG